MIIHSYRLPREHDVTHATVDTRQLMILGPLRNGQQYPVSNIPIVSDIRQLMPHWKGGVVFGNTTHRLKSHHQLYNRPFSIVKTCAYYANPQKSNPDTIGPEVVEYLGIEDGTGLQTIYKCRRRRWFDTTSYVFPEQIDKFANYQSAHSWFQNSYMAMISGQIGAVDVQYDSVLESLLEFMTSDLLTCDLVAYDHYTPRPIVSTITTLLHDLTHGAEQSSDGLPSNVIEEWSKIVNPKMPFWDVFAAPVQLGKTVQTSYLLRYLGHNPYDLTIPPPVEIKLAHRTFPISINYMDVAENLEVVTFTDFSASAQCGSGAIIAIAIEYEINRFAATWSEQDYTADRSLIHATFNLIYLRYATLAPHISTSLIEIRITKTFNEEALIEFYHINNTHDHAMYVDFALLSYCSLGIGRFFNSLENWPT